MAKHTVKSFTINISPPGNSVQIQIMTDRAKSYQFELTPDINYPTTNYIMEKLNTALNHCVNNYEKVDISIFKERNYITINVKDFIDIRFSGKVV